MTAIEARGRGPDSEWCSKNGFVLAVDDAHATFTHAKVEGLIRRAGLRYLNATSADST